MRKIVIALLLVGMSSTSSYALNIIDRIIYREVYLKSYNQRLLVGRLTGEVEYIWQTPSIARFTTPGVPEQGEWARPISENYKKMWQDIYDKERSGKSSK